MAGYREITVAGEARPRRPARVASQRPPAGGWRATFVWLARSLGSQCRERPGTVLGGFLALGASGLICFNALGHQTGRHPAPILPKLAAKAPAKPNAMPVRDTGNEAVRDGARPLSAPAPKQAARDAIGDLIRADDTTASVTPRARPSADNPIPGAVPTAKDAGGDPQILRAQRALAKLGYGPIKADGSMGPATRAAIEKFERDRRLPVTGEAAGRTLRALEAAPAKG